MRSPSPVTGRLGVVVAAALAVKRQELQDALAADAGIEVVATACDLTEAAPLLRRLGAKVVVLALSGNSSSELAQLEQLMQTHPLPVVVCGDVRDFQTSATGLGAVQAGAIACVEFPPPRGGSARPPEAGELLQVVKLMSEIRVVRRNARPAVAPAQPASATAARLLQRRRAVSIVGMGASTGGPLVLQDIFSRLPAEFAAPILLVQHIALGFLLHMVRWLDDSCALDVQIAQAGAVPRPGCVYVAPDDMHMGVGRAGEIVLSHAPPEKHVRPAVSHLFRTLTHTYGRSAAGVLLTGMGDDGADELKRMRDAGGITIVQDKESSAVHGMPGSAIAQGAAAYVLPPARIAEVLTGLVGTGP